MTDDRRGFGIGRRVRELLGVPVADIVRSGSCENCWECELRALFGVRVTAAMLLQNNADEQTRCMSLLQPKIHSHFLSLEYNLKK